MKIVIGILVFIIIVVFAGLAYIYTGFYDISASNKEEGFTRWLFETTMENSVEYHANTIKVPILDSTMVFKGFANYDKMCGCHGAPGKENAKSFNPVPPELVRTADNWEPNELFWIIKNGIKMSAMPSFGERASDDEIWNIVAFLQVLPNLNEGEYQAMKFRLQKMK